MKHAIILDDTDLKALWYYDLPSPYHAQGSGLDSRPFEFVNVSQEEADNFRQNYGGKKTDFDPNLHTLLVSKKSMKSYILDKLGDSEEFRGKYITDLYFGDNGFVLEVSNV